MLTQIPTFVDKPSYPSIFIDGIEHKGPCYNTPDSPLYLVWGPDGVTPVRYLFTKLKDARKAARNMAQHNALNGSVFYVATFVSCHQEQVGPVDWWMNIAIGDIALHQRLSQQ